MSSIYFRVGGPGSWLNFYNFQRQCVFSSRLRGILQIYPSSKVYIKTRTLEDRRPPAKLNGPGPEFGFGSGLSIWMTSKI